MTVLNTPENENRKFTSPALFAEFVTNGKWKAHKHLSLIDKYLVRLANRKIHKLLVNLPPRHGKSELISKFFPAWYLGNFPSHRIILSSYGASFATSWGKRVREIILEHGEKIFGINLSPISKSAGDFGIAENEGGMNCVGAGGPITGKGAELFIIDDPVKNDAEAHSQVYRDNLWEWFKATAYTRLEPDGIMVIIMTRWHEDDLCGRIINSDKIRLGNIYDDIDSIEDGEDEVWHLIKIPAIAEDNDPLCRQPGEPLWKRRFPLKKLLDIKKTIGEYWFSALYQQSPSPLSGDVFKRSNFRYFKIENSIYILKSLNNKTKTFRKEDCSIYAALDLAATNSEKSDYTVAVIFAVTPDKDILILDVIREKVEASEHLNLLNNIYAVHKPLMIGIEAVQYQIVLVQEAIKLGLPAISLKADKEKRIRCLPMAARMQNGIVYFLENADWLGEFEKELLAFPNAKHDDQVDAFAYISVIIQPFSGNTPVGAGGTEREKRRITNDY